MSEEKDGLGSIEDGRYSQSVQALRPNEFELLLSLFSMRDISQKTRDALKLIFDHGYTISFAAQRAGVSYRHVSAAEKKLMNAHKKIMAVYGKY